MRFSASPPLRLGVAEETGQHSTTKGQPRVVRLAAGGPASIYKVYERLGEVAAYVTKKVNKPIGDVKLCTKGCRAEAPPYCNKFTSVDLKSIPPSSTSSPFFRFGRIEGNLDRPRPSSVQCIEFVESPRCRSSLAWMSYISKGRSCLTGDDVKRYVPPPFERFSECVFRD